jgi:hypothetical protein
MTHEAWVYPTNADSARPALFKGDAQLVYGLFSGDVETGAAAQLLMEDGTHKAFSSTALPLNTWSHLAATYDGSNLRLFVDGQQVATEAVQGPIAADSHPLRFGGGDLLGHWFAGKLDEIRVYDRAITSTQVRSDMDRPVVG